MTNRSPASKSGTSRHCYANGDSTYLPALSKPSQELLTYYKNKAARAERELDNLSDVLDKVKVTCDLSHELQTELNLRSDEVSRLQVAVSDLQVCLFREREQNLKLNSENDELRIEHFEDKKKINVLLQLSGSSQHDLLYFVSDHPKAFVVPQKLPPKLRRMQESLKERMKQHLKYPRSSTPPVDTQALLFQNEALTSQLEQHLRLYREQMEGIIKDRELAAEERRTERLRLNQQVDKLTLQLKQAQDNLCETFSKLMKCQVEWDKEKTYWMEEQDKYLRTIRALSDRSEVVRPERLGHPLPGVGVATTRAKTCAEVDLLKLQVQEKEQLASLYQDQAKVLEAEVARLKDDAETCRQAFKEKTVKMTAQVSFLKSKYDELDRRRILEAEGFRTDIRMLRQRLKELEKKLVKANMANTNHQKEEAAEGQLLVSVRNTLTRAKQLERELGNIRTKITQLESNQ